MIVKLEGRQPIFAFRTKNLQFFANGEFEEVFAINSKQDKEKTQVIRSVLPSILTKYCKEFTAKTALSSNLRRLTIPTLVSAKYNFCVVPAPTKANEVKNTVEGENSEKCPATILRNKDNAIKDWN